MHLMTPMMFQYATLLTKQQIASARRPVLLPVSFLPLMVLIMPPSEPRPRPCTYAQTGPWSHNGGNIFTFRTLLSLGADPGRQMQMVHYWFMRQGSLRGLCFVGYFWIEVCKLTRGTLVAGRHCHILSVKTYASYCWIEAPPLTLLTSTDARRVSHCAGLGNEFICKPLLDRGAVADSTDSNGRTYCAELYGYGASAGCCIEVERLTSLILTAAPLCHMLLK